MRVGLIDVDSHNFPNLCLMKLSEYHTRHGDRVEWWDPAKQYDLVYKSRVFTDTYSKDTIQVSNADMDILPSDLSTYGGAAKDLLTDLQSRNERMFNMTFLVLHTAETRQKLEIAVSQAASVAQTYNCLLTRLDFQQEDGLMSSLPLGLNRIKIERSLTTSALAVFVPFVTQEVFMGGDAMYYGLNALSNNMILLDRKQSRCPNGLVFGTPGSGKSMSCKREITFIMLMTQDIGRHLLGFRVFCITASQSNML